MTHKGDDEHLDVMTGATQDLTDETAEVGPLEPGLILNERFEIVEHVYSGGMGHVYKAVDYRRNRIGAVDVYVAIKVMRSDISLSHDAGLFLKQEAAKAQSLSHPNIVKIFHFDEHAGYFYLVIEWLEGESLRALLRRTGHDRLPPDKAWSIIEGVAAAVEHAHRHNVVHADIKPANIFVTHSGEVKLLDFGVARICDGSRNSTDTKSAWFTPIYASPEVLARRPPVFEDDVFALGCVAYRLLSGTHVFGALPSSAAKQLGVEAKRIAGLSDSDWEILRRSLAYRREDRLMPVSGFCRHQTTELPTSDYDRSYNWWRRPWPLAAAIAAMAIIAAVWWI